MAKKTSSSQPQHYTTPSQINESKLLGMEASSIVKTENFLGLLSNQENNLLLPTMQGNTQDMKNLVTSTTKS
jgi:hypothetical protein